MRWNFSELVRDDDPSRMIVIRTRRVPPRSRDVAGSLSIDASIGFHYFSGASLNFPKADRYGTNAGPAGIYGSMLKPRNQRRSKRAVHWPAFRRRHPCFVTALFSRRRLRLGSYNLRARPPEKVYRIAKAIYHRIVNVHFHVNSHHLRVKQMGKESWHEGTSVRSN
jgi:hypothetical protein